jgi:hypothetical protein
MVRSHPQIHVSDFKEVHFFSTVHGDGLWERRDWAWYSSLYAKKPFGAVSLEFSPGYMIEPDVADRLAEHAPRVRLVSVIRDPVERARSHYHYLNNGKFPLGYSLDDLCFRPSEVDIPGRKHILGHGLYARNLGPFLQKFPRHSFHFIVQERLKTQPAGELAAFFRFLGVDADFTPPALQRDVNVAQAIRSPRLYWLNQYVANALERNGLSAVRRGVKRLGLPLLLKHLNTVDRPNPALTSEQQESLRGYYSKDVADLSTIVGADLAALWWGSRQ